MNSSVEQLKNALELLIFDTSTSKDGMGLGDATQAAKQISESFVGVNSSLCNGWKTAADFFDRIQAGVGDICYELYNEMNNYVEETKQIEQQARIAVEEANEVAKQILNELDLNGDITHYLKPVYAENRYFK